MKVLKYSILFCLFFSCSNPALQEELKETQAALEQTKAALTKSQEALRALEAEESAQLVHVVFFKLKPRADALALIGEVKKLEAIEEVNDLEVGLFENLGDQRALDEYTMVMELAFENMEAYQRYQAHPVHLALKESAKAFLAGPPATYDYIKR